MVEITSQPLVILDTTDSRKLEVYITSNHPTVQIYDRNDGGYTPDWSTTGLELSARVYLNSEDITDKINETDDTKKLTLAWSCKLINSDEENLTSDIDDPTSVTISNNVLTDANMVVTYTCSVEYQNLEAFSKIVFSRADTGLNGADGADGTSVRILGTATAVNKVDSTDYYTITYSSSAITAAALGDAYLYNGNLYVCAVIRDEDDYFINVGNIQGPAGSNGVDAKLITLNSSSQVFKISNTGAVTPSTITVTATPINTLVSEWTYSTDGGKTFAATVPNGISRNGNTITVTGLTMSVNSVVIKASDGTYKDTLTIHKVFDGATGAKGDSASMAFLTNENISFAANASGCVSATSITTNVVAYNGTEKVMPTVGIPSGMPNGMTISVDSDSLATSSKEAILTISITNNSTLGSPSSNSGTVTIPITSPVSTNLILSWSKINTGTSGEPGATGSPATAYWLMSSASVIQKSASGTVVLTPSTLTFTGKSKTGTSAPVDYGCRWVIDYSTDGSTYTNAYTSTTNEATKTFTADSTYKTIRARMYLAGGTTTLLDEQIIPVVADGAVGNPGVNAVTFQIYSSNGYALSTNIPNVTLQTFAYVGDVAITAGATYQWYVYSSGGWSALSGETSAYLNISREDVEFSKSYMCKMTFNNVEYTSVATIDDKNDDNKVFTTKPSNYASGDLWIVGVDYIPSGFEVGTLLRAEHTNSAYSDNDWVTATKYDNKINDIQTNIDTYNQYFSFDSTNGVTISARDANGQTSNFSTSLTNTRLAFNYGNQAVAYIDGTKMNIKEAVIESPLTVTGKYSGSTMLQAPVINIGNFSIIVESNGSLSIVANT